jgi:hypothetical protein
VLFAGSVEGVVVEVELDEVVEVVELDDVVVGAVHNPTASAHTVVIQVH